MILGYAPACFAGMAVVEKCEKDCARTRPGFDPDHLLTFQLAVGQQDYPNAAKVAPYQARLIEALEAIPGVRAAAFVNQLPLTGRLLQYHHLPRRPHQRPASGAEDKPSHNQPRLLANHADTAAERPVSE
jgi:hypothetical protein